MKLCRYNWHSAGSMGWPFPMLKYEYIFQIKHTDAILSNSTRKLLCFEICKMLITVLKKYISCVICYNFPHLSVYTQCFNQLVHKYVKQKLTKHTRCFRCRWRWLYLPCSRALQATEPSLNHHTRHNCTEFLLQGTQKKWATGQCWSILCQNSVATSRTFQMWWDR